MHIPTLLNHVMPHHQSAKIISYGEELVVYSGIMIFHDTSWGMWHNDDRKTGGCSLLVKVLVSDTLKL